MDLIANQKWIPGYEGKYFADMQGSIFRLYQNGKIRRLAGFQNGNVWVVKLTGQDKITKEMQYARVIWETFKGPIPPGYLVVRKLSILNENGILNLRLRTKSQHGKRTGPTSRSKAVVLLDAEGLIIDSWSSARKAAKDLFVSYQTVMDVCNGKVKKPIINVRWSKGSDLEHRRLPEEFKEGEWRC